MHKKRGYNRETPVELVRDYRLFAIACEGRKREPEYFKVFQHASGRIKVDIIENVIGDAYLQGSQKHNSSPKWVLDRTVNYIDKTDLKDEDYVWFVMDVDSWPEDHLREIFQYCTSHPNWQIILSNPCFEVWLYLHKKSECKSSNLKTAQDFKREIALYAIGGYHPYKFIPNVQDAIKNARAIDTDPNHFMPKPKSTKVYLLGEELLKVIGKKDFDEFINNTLPELIRLEKAKRKKRKTSRSNPR